MTRFYDAPDGRKLPSVTTVLQILSKGDGLLRWYATNGWEEATRRKNESADLGTAVHALCEAINRTSFSSSLSTKEDVPIKIPCELQPYATAYRDWLSANVLEVLAVEQQVHHLGEGYSGTLDLAVRLKDEPGIPAIVDLKTSNGGGVYAEFRLQLTAYAMAAWETLDLLCPRRLIVQLPSGSPGELHVHELPRDAFRRDWDGFRAALALWRWAEATKEAGRKDLPLISPRGGSAPGGKTTRMEVRDAG